MAATRSAPCPGTVLCQQSRRNCVPHLPSVFFFDTLELYNMALVIPYNSSRCLELGGWTSLHERETVWKEISCGLWSHFSCVTLNAHERISHSLRFFAALRMTAGCIVIPCRQPPVEVLKNLSLPYR